MSVPDSELDEHLCELHAMETPCWKCREDRELERAEQRFEKWRDE
ncbi:MAG: hypothetical protein OJF50_002501 [Nitrospira sp.]|nr:hypothetical protein [Nitrospira sp.]